MDRGRKQQTRALYGACDAPAAALTVGRRQPGRKERSLVSLSFSLSAAQTIEPEAKRIIYLQGDIHLNHVIDPVCR